MTRITRLQNKFFDATRSRKAAEAAKQPGTAQDLAALDGRYALVVTFKRDGEPVPTPVWFGVDEGKLYFRTESDTAKVTRIRNDPHVRVGPCNGVGKPQGPLTEARARVLPPEEEEHAEAAIQSNYGKGREIFESMGDRMGVETVYIEVTPA
jgi:PPOX class probable F420-dependent enzyme